MLFDSLFLHDIHEHNLRRGPDAVLPAPGAVAARDDGGHAAEEARAVVEGKDALDEQAVRPELARMRMARKVEVGAARLTMQSTPNGTSSTSPS